MIMLDKIKRDHIVFSGKKYAATRHLRTKLCDFIVFENASANPVNLALLEMKSGRVSANDFATAFDQLMQGAKFADSLAGTAIRVVRFVPLIAKNGG